MHHDHVRKTVRPYLMLFSIGFPLAGILTHAMVESCGAAHHHRTQQYADPVPMCRHAHAMAAASDDVPDPNGAIIPRRESPSSECVLTPCHPFVSAYGAHPPRGKPPDIASRERRLAWVWSRTRPFSSTKKYIPHYAPLRDA